VTHAAITGWGKCLPPNVLTNADLATFLDTNDEWITSRTGIRERRISHVPLGELCYVSAMRALACAGLDPSAVELIVVGSCSFDDQVPNQASGLQVRLGAKKAAAYDVNTACTSFLYALSTANALIRTGVVKNAVVVGGELISAFMEWDNRGVSVLFGDGCAAVVLQAVDHEEGVIAEKLGCYADARDLLRVRGVGVAYANRDVNYGDTAWDFDGQEIFKRAVLGMSHASSEALAHCGKDAADIGLVVPHQANRRIIEFVAKKAGIPMDRVIVTVHKYGNMSSATVPVALVDALAEGRVAPRSLLLMPAFGGGLTWCSHVVRWGERTTPLDTSDLRLPACEQTALEIVQGYMKQRGARGRSAVGLAAPVFPELLVESDEQSASVLES